MKREDITKDAVNYTLWYGVPCAVLLFLTFFFGMDKEAVESVIIALLYIFVVYVKVRQDNIVKYLNDKK